MLKFYKFLILGVIIVLAFFASYSKKVNSKIITVDANSDRSQSPVVEPYFHQALTNLADNPSITPAFFEEELASQSSAVSPRTIVPDTKYLLINKPIQEISTYIFQELLLREKNRKLIKKEIKEAALVSQEAGFLGDAKSNKIEIERFDFEEPGISAEAALVADLDSGQVYWAAREEKRLPIASLTKLMTAVVAMKNMSLDESIEIKNETNFKNNLFLPGKRYWIKDVIKIMLLSSDNDAAEILAQSYGEENFIDEMNKLAKSWGLENTFFDDPAGISAANQSTAEDIKKMMIEIDNFYPEILKITRRPKETIIELTTKRKQSILNINQFAGRPNFLGGKTGYTEEAGGNLVSIFNYKNRPIILVVLGTKNHEARFEETEKLFEWFKNNF